ncbi:MAG TPA: sigma-70 family RNA polymerase sigma factor [Verrucomicrobiae bacterium]|nr:sigma-70 family RNA polymerase sigma factor [Verrucomicrobiae bacterium]
MHDDLELLREHVKGGSEDALRLLVERHASMVHGAALRMVRDAAVAEEISQAVFTILARKAATLPEGTVLAGWLYQTTRFVALGAMRAERRRQQYHHDFASMNDTAESAALWDQVKPHLDEALGQLGARDRDALVLRFLEGRSFAEVGDALGTTEAAAKMCVSRALEKLRIAIGHHGDAVTVVALTAALAAHGVSAVPVAVMTKIGVVAVATSAPSPNLLMLVNEAMKLMTLQKLKTTLVATLALVLLGGGVTLFFVGSKPVKPALAALAVTTFEPMAGEWAGTYETHSLDQPRPRRQIVALTIGTSNQGRVCDIDMRVLDQNDRVTASFHFTHALNDKGDRIVTTDDPNLSGTIIDGAVTEAVQNLAAAEWRAAFHATKPGTAGFTQCRWVRLKDDLTISREDATDGLRGSTRLFSVLQLRPRNNKARTAYNALPRDLQTFDGVTFLIQKPINIIGAKAGKAKGRASAQVSDPSIVGRGRNIHVLHTGDHGSSATGDFIWRLVLHYADGGSERFDFAYDVHLRNFWRRAGDGPPTPSDPNTSLAWIGSSVESDRTGAELVVSRTTLANPRPDVEVTGADFVSLLGPSSAYVLAVTVNDEGPKPVPQVKRSASNVSPLTFVIQNAAGQPQAGVPMDCTFECDGFFVQLAQAHSDGKGQVNIEVPTQAVHAIHFQAGYPDGRTQPGIIEVSAATKAWSPQVVRLPE